VSKGREQGQQIFQRHIFPELRSHGDSTTDALLSTVREAPKANGREAAPLNDVSMPEAVEAISTSCGNSAITL
jgi:hypothetical protein